MPLPVVDPSRYAEQLDAKRDAFREAFAALTQIDPEIFASAPTHYRMRAQFRIWHDGPNLDYVMLDPAVPDLPIIVREFPITSRRINELIRALRHELMNIPALAQRLFQVEFLTTLSAAALFSRYYPRAPKSGEQLAAAPFYRKVGTQLISRSRKEKIVIGNAFVDKMFNGAKRHDNYGPIEGSST